MSVNFFAHSTAQVKGPRERRAPRGRRGLLAALRNLLWLPALFSAGCAHFEGEASRHPKAPTHLLVRTTAYTHTEAGGVNNAIGSRLRFGSDVSSASADWSWLPLGTRFRVQETGRAYVIEDYGSGLVGKKTIDLYMPNMAMMRAWGVRNVHVEILEWGSRPISKMLLERRKGGETARRMLSSMDSER